ncbi:MAG: L-serine ammonia-lyase, iron-sulfur-dependent, subunit alpha [Desulfobacterales bacterium]
MKFTVKHLLQTEVAPALGCTEPVAIALCAAAAASLLEGETIEGVEVQVDPNIYKNGYAVAIPGTSGLKGLDTAAALGALGGSPHKGLEVLETVTPEIVKAAQQLIAAKGVRVGLLDNQRGLRIKARVQSGGHSATCEIKDFHNRIVGLQLDGRAIEDHPLLAQSAESSDKTDALQIAHWVAGLSLTQLMDLLDELDTDDLAFIEEGIQYNFRLAEYGLKHGSGLGIGKALQRLVRQGLLKEDMITSAKILASGASDARMAGANLPAMSSAGSGNHGLTATLPIWAIRNYVACDRQTLLKAVALSHIITSYVKAHTGRLTAICGCSVAAGAGATAGITYLMGGDIRHIAGAIKNLTEDLAGVICDGAKAGCSLKLATAAGSAVQAALFSLQGVQVQPTDGIIAASPEKTMQNVGTLSTQGMVAADHTILKIILDKQFSHT